MYAVLDKDTIKTEILPCLSTAKRGFETKSCLIEIINAILYKLKTGCQWEHLPVKALFPETVLSHGAVFHHFLRTDSIFIDEEMYAERYSVERTNAWMDSFRTILNRFDTTVTSWESWNYIAFAVLLLKKISRKRKV